MDLTDANTYIQKFDEMLKESTCLPCTGSLKTGVDLGTANIVISVLDEQDNPVAGATFGASVVKDGLVVDYVGAVSIVKRLKSQIEEKLGRELVYTATAVPPGTVGGNREVIANVCESAGMEVVNVVDEPSAAAAVLGIREGAVVDVGGGTTGISILRDGKVIYTADEPTGGTHMSLVLAGHYRIPFEEAELIKKEPGRSREVIALVKPVVEKMAHIVKRHIRGYDINSIYVVGGACSFDEFESIFERILNIKTFKPVSPLLVTPLGIAQNCHC
ncbi:MAG: ethanolamine utilization protein EutJ [Bacillota bacterium]